MYESDHDVDYWNEMTARLTQEIQEEDNLWKQNSIHSGMLNINAHLIQMKINTLIKVIRKMGMSEEELDALFKESVLEQLKSDRAVIIEAKKKAARPDIAVAQRPPLLGPNGQPYGLS